MNRQLRPSVAAFTVVTLLCLAGCKTAWKTPEPIDQVDFREHARTLERNGLHVTVAVPDEEETERLFGTKLYREGVQPVWVEIDNRTDQVWLFMESGMDRNGYSPLEASYQRHSGSRETRTEMDLFFYDMHFKNPVLPGEVTSGFVFTNLDEGFKAVNVDLVTDGGLETFTFVIKVPGLVTDVERVDLDTLYDDITDLQTEEELIGMLEGMPCCTTNKDGSKNGDPINVVFIGDRRHIFAALIRRDWHQTEVTYAASAARTVRSFLFGSRYRYSPISPLYTYGRSQDLGLQKARHSIHLRNHMRIWRTPYQFRGEDIFAVQISRDIGVKLDWPNITTHAIDPNIDNTRDNLISDLVYSQAVYAIGYVKGSQVSTFDDPHFNLTPDPYYSDGLRAVLFFSQRATTLDQVEVLQWESSNLMDIMRTGER